MEGIRGSGGWPAGAEWREESEAVNESFWDATGVEIEAKQDLGHFGPRGRFVGFWASRAELDFVGPRGLSLIFYRKY